MLSASLSISLIQNGGENIPHLQLNQLEKSWKWAGSRQNNTETSSYPQTAGYDFELNFKDPSLYSNSNSVWNLVRKPSYLNDLDEDILEVEGSEMQYIVHIYNSTLTLTEDYAEGQTHFFALK